MTVKMKMITMRNLYIIKLKMKFALYIKRCLEVILSTIPDVIIVKFTLLFILYLRAKKSLNLKYIKI